MSKEELERIDSNFFYDGYIEKEQINEYADHLEIFEIPICGCISDGQKNYIIGIKRKTFSRKIKSCNKIVYKFKGQNRLCGELICCDKCIGETINGYYDLDEISKSAVECKKQHICGYCWNENNLDKQIKFYYVLDDCLSCT